MPEPDPSLTHDQLVTRIQFMKDYLDTYLTDIKTVMVEEEKDKEVSEFNKGQVNALEALLDEYYGLFDSLLCHRYLNQ